MDLDASDTLAEQEELELVCEEVQRICTVLGLDTPDEVVFQKSSALIPMSKVKDNGKRIEVVRSVNIETYRFQIGRAYWSTVVGKSPNWVTRNLFLLVSLCLMFFVPNLLLAMMFIGTFSPSVAFSVIVVLQVGYSLAAYKISRMHSEKGEIVSEMMMRIESWNVEDAKEYCKRLLGNALVILLMAPFLVIFFTLISIF